MPPALPLISTIFYLKTESLKIQTTQKGFQKRLIFVILHTCAETKKRSSKKTKTRRAPQKKEKKQKKKKQKEKK